MSKKHSPTEANRTIAMMAAALGIPHEIIAKEIGIDAKTLRLHYAIELRDGAARATFRVGLNLYNIATSFTHPKGAAMAAFWMKCRGGWSEFAPAPAARPEAVPKLGKKEQAAMDASEPPTHDEEDWGSVPSAGSSLN